MNWLRFSNPFQLSPELRQLARPTHKPRLGPEHADWRLLVSRGNWVVALLCGTSAKLLGPVTERYPYAQDAGERHWRLENERAIARGCYLRVLKMEDFWDKWGRNTPEFARYE